MNARGNSSDGAERFRSHAFGLATDASFQVPGLPADSGVESLPTTRLDLADAAEIDEAWRPDSPELLLEERFDGPEPARTIEFDEQLGYRLYARHFGLALIAADGKAVVCAPPGPTDWSWQRFLVGRVLPWTALARGREVFHASAVRIGERAVAFAAPSGGGKTTLALKLALRGAGFVTDDVLAIERTAEGVLVHPGANIVAVRPVVRARIGSEEWQRLGRVLGHSVKTYVEVERESRPLPLDAIYFLSPSSSSASIERGVDAKELLASTFISSVVSPQRLAGLLDLCSHISSSVALFRLPVDSDGGAVRAASVVWDHAAGAAR